MLLVREAAGVVTDLKGGDKVLETGDVLATNEKLHLPLLKLLRDAGRG
jgi:myo-inositol-1(or 4)-monophosphatase